MEMYLNQRAVLERQADPSISPNIYGEIVYLEPESIKCRRENIIKVYERPGGDFLTSRAIYYTTVAVQDLDKLDGYPILIVETYVDFDGVTVGYRSVV